MSDQSRTTTIMHGEGTKEARIDSPLKAIRAKCIDCSGGSLSEVAKCEMIDCPLWPMRAGKNPFRKPRVLTEEQRQELAVRLSRVRKASL